MSLQHEKPKRRILPRWRASTKASQSEDFTSIKRVQKQPAMPIGSIIDTIDNFCSAPSLGTAAEALSSALLGKRDDDANNAAQFIISQRDKAPLSLLHLAESTLNIERPAPHTQTETELVRVTKKLLRLNSDNPMLWSDLARHYATHGDKERAKRCMKVALHQAPNHRWMLRSAARFFVHQEDPITAHRLLVQHPMTRQDPWLIAAELACAQVAERPPKYWKQANNILQFDSVSPYHMSELATAVGMMELESGQSKKARKILRKGVLDPTENTLAQIFWAKENRHLHECFDLDKLVQRTGDAYEADFRLNLLNGDMPAALVAAQTWQIDEPFATRPRMETAYIASLLDDHDLVINTTHDIYRLNRIKDHTLEMNAIYSILSSRKLSAESDADKIENIRHQLMRAVGEHNENTYHAFANLGLWHYRFGNHQIGQEMYKKAIEVAESRQKYDAAAMAATFAARESILAQEPIAAALMHKAQELTKRSKNIASEFYLRKLDALVRNPQNSDEILSPKTATQFIKINKPVTKFEIIKENDRFVLVVNKKKSN